MVKKYILIIVILTLVGCNATKPVIITTKKIPSKPKIHITKKWEHFSDEKSNKTNQENT